MQNIKVYLFVICLTFLTKCTSSYKTETIVENEVCKISQVNGKTFLVCDENNNLKVYIKKDHVVKELKNCKKTNFALEEKNSSKKYNSIICKTNYGYEIVR